MTTQEKSQTREELRLRGMSRSGRALPTQLHVQIGADGPGEFDPLGNWRPVVQYDCALPNDVTPYTGLWTSTLRTGTNGPMSAFWMVRSDTLRGTGYFWKIVPGPEAALLRIDCAADYAAALRHYPDARSGGLDFAALAGDFDLVHLTQLTTVGDGLCDELARRNTRLLTIIVRGLPGAPPGAPRWQQRSPRS